MDLDEAERWTRSVARDRREFAARRPLTVLLAEYDRRGATMVELDVALADAQAEIARLRGEVERYEVLTPQVCPAGEHPEWLIDSEHHHACPWCEIARLRPYLDKAQAHTCPAPDWYLKVRDLLGDVVLAAAFAGTDLADLPEHVRDLHAEVARLRAAVDAVRERHAKYDDGTCWEDGKDWPCPTVRALAAAPAPAEDEDEEA